MDNSSSTTSYRSSSTAIYDEGTTKTLYENLRSSMKEMEQSLKVVQRNLLSVQKGTALTAKLIKKIETAKQNSSKDKD